MVWLSVAYVLLLSASAVVLYALAIYVLRRRRTPRGVAGVVLLFANAGWALGMALEMASPGFPAKVFWHKLQYVGVAILPVAWIVYALLYAGHNQRITRRTFALLAAVPFVFVVLVFTNEAHGFVWSRVWRSTDAPFAVLDTQRGVGLWAFAAYAYALFLLGGVLLVRVFARTHRLYRRQAATVLAAACLPALANVADMLGLTPGPAPGLLPLSLVLTGVVAVWGVFRLRLGNIVPVAREVVIRSMSDAVVVLDAQNLVLDLNPVAERLIGHTAADAVGRSIAQVWGDWAGHVEHIQDGEEVVLNGDSPRRVYDVHVSPLTDWRRRCVGRVVVLHDITAYKQAEDALRTAEHEKALLLDSISELVTHQDRDLRIVWTNRAAAESVCPAPTELVGRPCYKVWQDRETPCPECPVIAAMETGRPQQGTVTTTDGRVLSVRGYPVRDGDGEVVGAVEVAQDITEREVLERQFLQAQKMEAVGQLAGGVAHDFNNLLTAIAGYTELLLCEPEVTEAMRCDLQEIEKAADRAATLTRQLLAFARRQVLRPTVLDLNVVVGDLAKMIRRLVGENVELSMALDPELGPVEADPGQIEQIIMNLVVNARDAMPHGGQLKIQTANVDLDRAFVRQHPCLEAGPYVMLSIADTGVGMDPETLSHLFEPFFTTKEQGKGTGLGLSTVFGIVRQHKGSVQPYSKLGQGTTFEIYLPRLDSVAMEASSEGTSHESLQGEATVLLAEDDQVVRTLACAVLRKHGYTVLEAENGLQAIAVSEQHVGPIDLLVTDVIMPGGTSGRELADRLVQLHPETKVLYMSGHTDDTLGHHGVLGSSVAFLQKPFPPSALAKMVQETLEGPVPIGEGRARPSYM